VYRVIQYNTLRRLRLCLFEAMKFKNISICVLVPALLSGCGAVPSVKDNKASGTFQEITGDGRSIILTIEPQAQGFTANGAVNGQSIVFSGTEVWRSLGAVTYAKGSFGNAKFGLTPDGQSLTVETSAIQTTSLVAIGGKPTTWEVSFSATDTDGDTAVAKVRLVVLAQPIL